MLMFAAIAYLTVAIVNFGRLVIEARSGFSFGEFVLYGLLWPLELAAWIEGLFLARRKLGD